jgi:regulator of sirC expression with transglutaminase-like and TPR domain
MEMLATVLQQDFGTQYNPARAVPQLRGEHEPSDVFFADSKDVFLHGLLGGSHQGTCSSLPVLYVAVAQRLGYPVSLASARGHFYVRYDDGPDHLNVDATTLGFKTETDEFYRHWPQAISDEEAKTYGLLRPMTKSEVLGSFLTIRAATLTSMRRFDEAAATWRDAARFLPGSPALKRIVDHAFARAKNERDADRWDQLWDEVANLEVRPDADYAYFRDRQIRLHMFMNQTTSLPAMERAAADLKSELESHRRSAMLDSDAPAILAPQRLGGERDDPAMGGLALIRPRVRIPAERVPPEYWQSIPQELQERLRGRTREEEIISEMWAFKVEELNRANQEARARLTARRPEPLPQNVQPEWLPEEYRHDMPAELRSRLRNVSGQAQIEWTAKQFQQEQKIRRQTEEMKRQIERQNNSSSRLTGPPVQIEIIPANTGAP